jgi:hypothetical protein
MVNIDTSSRPRPRPGHWRTVTGHEGRVNLTCFSPPLSDAPIPSLAAVASLPPPAAPAPACLAPPPLPAPPACTDTAFTGELLPQRRKIVHMILFAFEVDTLEIQLREAADLVDHYFLVEATLTHKGEPKPILWERLRSRHIKLAYVKLQVMVGFCRLQPECMK